MSTLPGAVFSSRFLPMVRKFPLQLSPIASPIQITNFLKDWLNKHILGTDQKYAPFLKTKGGGLMLIANDLDDRA